MKQVTEHKLITLDGAGISVMWPLRKETGGPGENLCMADHITYSPRRSNMGRSGDERVAYHCTIHTQD